MKVFTEDTPKRVLEKERGIVRSVYGSHTTNKVFNYLSRHPRIVEPARQLLGRFPGKPRRNAHRARAR